MEISWNTKNTDSVNIEMQFKRLQFVQIWISRALFGKILCFINHILNFMNNYLL